MDKKLNQQLRRDNVYILGLDNINFNNSCNYCYHLRN